MLVFYFLLLFGLFNLILKNVIITDELIKLIIYLTLINNRPNDIVISNKGKYELWNISEIKLEILDTFSTFIFWMKNGLTLILLCNLLMFINSDKIIEFLLISLSLLYLISLVDRIFEISQIRKSIPKSIQVFIFTIPFILPIFLFKSYSFIIIIIIIIVKRKIVKEYLN